MAICYGCDHKFYGPRCTFCGREAKYTCYDKGCRYYPITEALSLHHSVCGWYICNRCGQCGCNPNRPLSREEKLGYRSPPTRTS